MQNALCRPRHDPLHWNHECIYIWSARARTERTQRERDRAKSNQMLCTEWVLPNGNHLSARTIRRRLLDAGYKSYMAQRKPLRKPEQRKQRFSFAKEHQYWLNDWNKRYLERRGPFRIVKSQEWNVGSSFTNGERWTVQFHASGPRWRRKC